MKSLKLTYAFLRLIRFPNLLIIVATHFLIRYFILAPLLEKSGLHLVFSLQNFILLSLSVVFISAAGYVINDYFDRKTDIINKPGRVIIGRYINRRFAMLVHLLFNVIAISLGTYISFQINIPELSFVFVIVIGILWFYSTTYKRQLLIGNVIVSLFAGLVPLMVLLFEAPVLRKYYGSIIELMGTNFAEIAAWIIGFSVFAFLSNFIREIIKDIQDVKGDLSYGRNTLPIVWGTKNTKVLLLVLISVFALAVLLINVLYIKHLYSFLYSLILIILPLIVTAYYLWLADESRQYKLPGDIMKIVMFTGICYAFIAKHVILNL